MSRTTARPFRPAFEALEPREVPSAVVVNAGQTVRTLNDDVFGVNVNSWDNTITGGVPTQTTPDAGTVNLLTAAGTGAVRISNGLGSDSWHFNQQQSVNQYWTAGAGVLANLTAAAQAEGIVCVNFGTGTPQEAAAYLAYLNGSPNGNVNLGATWGSSGFWATLRTQAPVNGNPDGLNHLRVGRAAPFGFKFFEVGNEAYFGAWQNYQLPNPQAYAQFTATFAGLAAQIDANAKVGVGVGNPLEWDNVWNGPVLTACAQAGFTPKFLSDHYYVYDGNIAGAPLTDSELLNNSVSNPTSQMPQYHNNSPRNWAGRAAAYRTLLQNRLGAAAANVQLIVGEFNIDADAATRQGTNLAGGLWLADAYGSMIQTEYAAAAFWNLRNNYAAVPAVNGISGWRTGGDDGMVGVGFTQYGPPATGPYIGYPTYFAQQLAAKLGRTGDVVVPVTSDTGTVAAYAVKKADGRLSLLLINKSPTAADTANVSMTGFTPSGSANQWRYGTTEDNAQRDSANGASALTLTTPAFNVANGAFAVTLPAYSMTLLDLAPALVPPPPSAGVLFAPPVANTDPNLGPQTTVVVTGKFNNDNFLDAAVTNYGSANPNTISVVLGNGDGTFQPASKVLVATGNGRNPEGLVALDFDRDGDTDLAVTLFSNAAGNVVILRNNGSGTFTVDQTKTVAGSPTHLAAADFDGDTYPDLAVTVFGGGVKIIRNANTIFNDGAAVIGTGGTGSNQVVAADLDGDDDRDLAVANQSSGTVGVLANNGSGGFTLARTLTSGGTGATFLTALDNTWDNRPELFVSNTFGNTVSVFRNDGGLAFTRVADPVVGTNPTGITAGDFNGDGIVDLVVGLASTGKVAALMGDGNGGFLDPVAYTAAAGANGVAAGDFNADGRPDVMVSQYTSGNALAFLRNALIPTTTTVPAAGPVTAGQPVTLRATVQPATGATVATGYVSFSDGGNYIGTATVNGGVAELSVTLAAGAHAITAVYGDPRGLTWYGSGSAATTVTVNGQGGGTLTLTAATVTEFRPGGQTAGSLAATPAGTYTYTLVTGAGSTDNALFAIAGNQLRTARPLDSSHGPYSVRVRATSATGASVEQTFTITAADDPAVARSGRTFTVTGTAAADAFGYTAGDTDHALVLNGVNLAVPAADVDQVYFDGGAGPDTATLTARGTGNVAALWPGVGRLTRGATATTALAETITLYGGPADGAYLNDSAGNDILSAGPGYAILQGATFFNAAVGFSGTTAYASTGSDAAYLLDSAGDDVYSATPTYAFFTGPGFWNTAVGFDGVTAYTSTGSDAAYLTGSAGNDIFSGQPAYSFLAGGGFWNTAVGFDGVSAYGGGGTDAAYLTDGPGNDVFGGSGGYGSLSGPGYFVGIDGFAGVNVYGTSGGTNRKQHGSVNYWLGFNGTWV